MKGDLREAKNRWNFESKPIGSQDMGPQRSSDDVFYDFYIFIDFSSPGDLYSTAMH